MRVSTNNEISRNSYLPYGWGAPAALALVFIPGGGLGIMPIGGVFGPRPGVTGLPVGGTIIPPGETCGTIGFKFFPMLTADTSVCKSATDDVCPMPTRAPVSTSHSSLALDTRSKTWLTTLLNAACCFCAVSNCKPLALCSTYKNFSIRWTVNCKRLCIDGTITVITNDNKNWYSINIITFWNGKNVPSFS